MGKIISRMEGERVLLFRGHGAGGAGPARIVSLCEEHDLLVDVVVAFNPATTDLSAYSCIIFPGGSMKCQKKSIGGAAGMAAVAEYVKMGGGYLGFCAGAFMGESLIGIEHCRNLHKGGNDLNGTVHLTLGGDDSENQLACNYHNGPVWPAKLPDHVETIAQVSDVNDKLRAVRNKMRAKNCIVASALGHGRVVLCGPHPEHTDSERAKAFTWRLICDAAGISP